MRPPSPGIRDVPAQSRGDVATLGRLPRLVQRVAQFGPRVQRQNQEGMQAGMSRLRVGAGRPVQESHVRQFLLAVRINASAQLFQQGYQILPLLAQITSIRRVSVPFVMDEHPPHGIGTNAVHPLRQRGLVTDQVQASGDDVVVPRERGVQPAAGMA